jgi:glycosyltransferase 2 family protein
MSLSNLKLIIKILITIGLLGWLITFVLESESVHIMQAASLPLLFAACVAHFTAYSFLLVRWQCMLGIYYDVPYRSLVNSFFIGLFANNFLPSSVGGDVVRASYLYRQGLALSELITSSVIDRFVGIVVTLILCVSFTALFSMGRFIGDIHVNDFLLLGGMLLMFPAVCYVILKLIFMHVQWIKRISAIYKALEKLKHLADVIKTQPKRLFVAALLSVASTISVVICYYMITLALGINVSLGTLFIVVPMSFFVASLPVSIGGLGVREGAIIFLLSKFNIPVEQSVALTAVYLCVLILVTAPNGLLILRKNARIELARQNSGG